MANTTIQLKYSTVTNKPVSLNIAEPAYSYTSNTLFIGTPDSLGTINIGGLFYTSQIDNATNLATPNTIVKRDASGNASFNNITANTITASLAGNANSATRLQTARFFNLTGDVDAVAVSFDGTANADFTLELTNTGVSSGTYGGSTNIPVIIVDADGRITSASNTSISTDLNIVADTGSNTIFLATDSLTFVGADGITTSIGPTDNVSFAVDNTVIRTTGTQTITGDLTVTGNIVLNGNTFTQNVTSVSIADPLLLLGVGNYFSDILDIGFVSHYNDGANAHTGLIRDSGTKEYHFFKDYTGEVGGNNNINLSDASYRSANVHAAYFKGNLIANTAVSDGFYGKTSTNQMFLYPSQTYNSLTDQYIIVDPTAVNHIHLRAGGTIDSSNAELFLGGENTNLQVSDTTKEVYIRANGISAATFANNGTLIVSGKVTANGVNLNDFSQSAFDKANSAVFSTSTLTSGAIILGAGSNNVTTLANSTYTQTGTLTAANTVTSFTVDAYGRTTDLTTAAIAISADQVTSGILPVVRGGSGASSFTLNSVLLGNSNSAFQTASSSTEGHLLTINASGVPTFSMLSGGTF
jgi:cytochrome c-type biogenesis protein CcmE